MPIVQDNEVVTYKQIASILKVGRNVALRMATNTRCYYGKKPAEQITLGQVMRANNLEK